MTRRLYLSIGFISSSIIGFQLALMHILSYIQWSHFAWMVISVALLGFGASGTILALAGRWMVRKIDTVLPLIMIACGVTMSSVLPFAERVFGTFDSYLVFIDSKELYSLLLTYFSLFVVFFLGALAIGLIYVAYVQKIGSLYFADLLGSGLGGLASLGLFWAFYPAKLPAVMGLLPIVAAALILPQKKIRPMAAITIASLAAPLLLLLYPPDLKISEYKGLARALDLPGAEVRLERTSPYGHIEVVTADALRYAPGLSMSFTGDIPVNDVVFCNGDWYGPVVSWSAADTSHFLDYTTNALPYIITIPETTMILEAGTGLNVSHAVTRGATSVTAVEHNRLVTDLLKNELAPDTDSLFHHKAVTVKNLHSRSYLLADTATYDLIVLPTIETFGGTSGIHALKEQYLLTREAFLNMWERLSDRGMISVTVWTEEPPRNILKLLGTLTETLQEIGVEDRSRHLMAVRGWGTVTFVVTREALTDYQAENIREFCSAMYFDPLYLPGKDDEERMSYNILTDSYLFELADRIAAGGESAEEVYRDYDFNIRPATDNRPYFSQFLKLSRLTRLSDIYGSKSIPFLEVGYLIVGITFIQITVAAIILIIVPLFFIGWRGGYRGYTVLHFSGLGIGFMFVEIVLIQRLVLYFGSPIYAAAAVLSAMLICSGAGSWYSSRMKGGFRDIVRVTGLIMVIIILYGLFLTPLLLSTISLPFLVKIAFSMVIIAPMAFFMGMPFPLGLKSLSEHNRSLVPWAWGINGCLSVISTALALIIAVEAGFLWVMALAAVAYGITMVANIWKAA